VVKIDAPDSNSVDLLRELLSVSSGDKDVIAEFAIGLNPGVSEPIGDIMLDEKIGGSIHIAIGMNERFGGRNKSNLHLDLVVLRPEVWLDKTLVIDDGILCTSVEAQRL
jgi:leucyl aminopeptidase (aminopeptidase T)